MIINRQKVIVIVLLVVVYILLGNARSIQENPIVPGANIAVNMIIPVLAGLLFGPAAGFSVGAIGTAINATITGSIFEFAAVVPHALMGLGSGILALRFPKFIAAFGIIIGHFLNILFFGLLGLLPLELTYTFDFWRGLGYEIFVGLVAIIVIYSIYNLASYRSGGDE